MDKYFNKVIEEYKIKKKKDNLTQQDYKEIVNIRYICSKINIYLNNCFTKKKNLNEQLKRLNLYNNNITEIDTVIFKRKNKLYTKTIYFF